LYHYHRTVIGVDISGNVSDSTPSGHLTLGYSRRLVIAMPKVVEEALKGEQGLEKLPQTIFCTQVKASLGGVNVFREILATGDPADGYAQQLATSAEVVSMKNRNLVCPGLEVPAPDAPPDPQSKNPPQALPTKADK